MHTNSARISASVRKVLRFPADNLCVSMDQSVKDLGNRRDETAKIKSESQAALKSFTELANKSQRQQRMVEDLSLEAPSFE